MKNYIKRSIDQALIEWKESAVHKPLLLRGARQVGKSSAVRQLGKQFHYFAEVNFERDQSICTFFKGDLKPLWPCVFSKKNTPNFTS